MESTEYTLKALRNELSELLGDFRELEATTAPPVVQEVVLARRALEDARMRLGVAEAMLRGHDPWTNQVTE